MKLVTLTFLSLFFTSLLFAQNVTDSIQTKEKTEFSFGKPTGKRQHYKKSLTKGLATGKRTHSPLQIDLTNGLSTPTGDFQNFANNGFSTGITINKNFCNNLSLGLQIGYSAFPVDENFGQMNSNWNNTAVIISPQYQIDLGGVGIYVYGGSGISFVNTPEIIDSYPNTDIISTRINTSNSSILTGKLGANFIANVCEGMQLFINTEYLTSINSNIGYQVRDLSAAINDEGNIDPDLANNIAFENKTLKLSSVNISFGVRIALNNKSNTNRTDKHCNCSKTKNVNPLYQNQNSQSQNPLYKSMNNNAQDYNSSRSNNDGIKSGAQDYNSSRSNNDGIKSDAQDYNSSRSNNDGIKDDSDTSQNDRTTKTKPVCPKGYKWKKDIGRCIRIN